MDIFEIVNARQAVKALKTADCWVKPGIRELDEFEVISTMKGRSGWAKRPCIS